MKAKLVFLAALGILLIAVPGGDGRDNGADTHLRMATQPVLSKSARGRLDDLIQMAERSEGARMTVEARTIEEAVKLAQVPKSYSWWIEHNGWFVFTDTIGGDPFFWSTTLVKKGTRKVVYDEVGW